jgi:hypothetical protein
LTQHVSRRHGVVFSSGLECVRTFNLALALVDSRYSPHNNCALPEYFGARLGEKRCGIA